MFNLLFLQHMITSDVELVISAAYDHCELILLHLDRVDLSDYMVDSTN